MIITIPLRVGASPPPVGIALVVILICLMGLTYSGFGILTESIPMIIDSTESIGVFVISSLGTLVFGYCCGYRFLSPKDFGCVLVECILGLRV